MAQRKHRPRFAPYPLLNGKDFALVRTNRSVTLGSAERPACHGNPAMKSLRLPEAFNAIRAYFSPLHFYAAMDSPSTITVTIRDEAGVSCTLDGIPCATSLSHAELFQLIRTVEVHLEAANPGLMDQLARPRMQFDGKKLS